MKNKKQVALQRFFHFPSTPDIIPNPKSVYATK